MAMTMEVFKLSPRLTLVPVLHGSGDVAVEVRRLMLNQRFDCLAVPLPSSFQASVESAVLELPSISLVCQSARPEFDTAWQPESDSDDDSEAEFSYVPIDPCQPVVAAIRIALGERIPRAFIDLETRRFESHSSVLPDPYALKKVSIEKFATAILPAVPKLPAGQPEQRVSTMAARLRKLEKRHRSILCLVSISEWPWLRSAYREKLEEHRGEDVSPPKIYQPDERTFLFLLGELPFITGLYEKARSDLGDDENLSIDGVKELLLTARTLYKSELKKLARTIGPQALSLYLRYVRNLSLIERRLTPDLYTLVVAAKQIAGSRFAISVAETAREYPVSVGTRHPKMTIGIDRGRLENGETVRLVSRLPGAPMEWRSLDLKRRPEKTEQKQWMRRWNPYSTVSWLPEDIAIERFRTHCIDRAKEILTADLARSEKFTTSIMDGIDTRETLRNWHTGELYVKNYPPRLGSMDCVVMLFDVPADPRNYPFRLTWHAEFEGESTLAFFGTDFASNLVGPGIGQSTYGGAMFIYPPIPIPEIWTDRALNFAVTLEEKLLAAACFHSENRHIALLSPTPPGAGWRRMARRFGKKWVHLPLAKFSQSTIEKLRIFHVLNGKQVRSYAAKFIQRG